MGRIRIKADRSRCVSSGQCAATSLELFDQGEEDGIVVVLNEEPPPELLDKARLAVILCPAQAISIEE